MDPFASPTCWTLWGSRRNYWIEQGRSAIRDKFGFLITENTWVITNAFSQGERTNEMVDYVLASGPTVAEMVDYLHGLHWQHNAVVKMMDEELDCELCEIVSVRDVLHFVHLWKRNARMKVLTTAVAVLLVRNRSRGRARASATGKPHRSFV